MGLWKETNKGRFLLHNRMVFFVEDGRRVRFWKDKCGNDALCDSFPSLYALAASKEVWVAKVWDSMGEEGGWNPRFSKPFNDWEVEVVERFLLKIQGKGLISDLEDRVLWKKTKDGKFSVKSLYSALELRYAVPFLRSIIWSSCVPTKVGFFPREASWGKVLTLDQLKRREWSIPNTCFLCCAEEVSIDHILIHCIKAKVLWELLFALFGVMWVLHLSIRDTLLGWHDSFMGKKCRKVWRVAPLCLFWSV